MPAPPAWRRGVPAAVDPASLIRSKKWPPGAWTPARCELWRQREDLRERLEKWVTAEHARGQQHPTQLPNIKEA